MIKKEAHFAVSDIKISIIGAGGSFTVGLIHDLCLTPNLYGSTISLMDINEERLNSAYNIFYTMNHSG